MDLLFVHNNFPGQFRHLARALANKPGYRVFAIGTSTATTVAGVELIKYATPTGLPADNTHPFARQFASDCVRAEQVLYAAASLKARGVEPEVIVIHPGWGEALPMRELFPSARIVAYSEYFYHSVGADVGFDPEGPTLGIDGRIRVRTKNATTLLSLVEADIAVSPTEWQKSLFPAEFQSKIVVAHEGVDVATVKPNADASIRLKSGSTLTAHNQVITFSARNLEPYRGFHIFMRALPAVLRALPDAHVVIIGGAKASYGPLPPNGGSWRQLLYDEVRGDLDPSRVHFLGKVSYDTYLAILQVSTAHVYLTYPFVLSWSAVEALAAGCLVIGSDTPPVREVITDGENGLIVPFFDRELLSERLVQAVKERERFRPIRANAVKFARSRFDRDRVCVPNQIAAIMPPTIPG